MPGEAELRLRERLSKLKNTGLLRGARLSGELDKLQRQLDRIEHEATDEEIWHSVELARHDERPYTLDYVERLFDDFFELHGDRFRADDPAVVAGLARLGDRTVAIVGQQKGRDIKERTRRNFGMAYPEGYRKAMRTMQLADTFGIWSRSITACERAIAPPWPCCSAATPGYAPGVSTNVISGKPNVSASCIVRIAFR